ncbi:MAG: UDP-N-acetylmuramoyl-tripeptide--D-alanyl-D-alanine ligase [Gammaproteobacteria bacterium]|nr:UDP-N-acetylmuramoyl-tripeptide--D-alanyl-D-alanine ligase [Gammaproteobacteria bacterium]
MLSLKQLAQRIGAEYIGEDLSFHGVSIDSRTLESGQIYVAIRREKDGHEFIADAIEKGASAVLVDHLCELTIPQIIVKDTLKALGDMAHVWRAQFHIPIIALTGSCGKTTTKEMIASILRESGPTLATQGNFNNAYGLPLTLLQLTPRHRYAVLEMGTNSPGEIDYIARIAEPTVALITNIGASHLEKLGSYEGVSKEKSDIFVHLKSSGIAVIDLTEPYALHWAEKIDRRHVVTYGNAPQATVRSSNIHFHEQGVDFDLNTPIGTMSIGISLSGQHIVKNAVAAAAVALSVGASLRDIAVGLSKMEGVPGRFHKIILKNGCILIDDSYNASVNAVKNAIDTLALFKGKKIFVMTHLGELGADAALYHQKVGEWCRDAHLDQVFLCGNQAVLTPILMLCPQARYFNDKQALFSVLQSMLMSGTMVLIKGVHSQKMDEIVSKIVNGDV